MQGLHELTLGFPELTPGTQTAPALFLPSPRPQAPARGPVMSTEEEPPAPRPARVDWRVVAPGQPPPSRSSHNFCDWERTRTQLLSPPPSARRPGM